MEEINDIETEINKLEDAKLKSFLKYVWDMELEHPESVFWYKDQYIKNLRNLIKED